jgi:hypothetical protein
LKRGSRPIGSRRRGVAGWGEAIVGVGALVGCGSMWGLEAAAAKIVRLLHAPVSSIMLGCRCHVIFCHWAGEGAVAQWDVWSLVCEQSCELTSMLHGKNDDICCLKSRHTWLVGLTHQVLNHCACGASPLKAQPPRWRFLSTPLLIAHPSAQQLGSCKQ